ncbi:MAG: hypothetical protein KKD38_03360 [Candidatus Delongbacteria bacterium]|nr:hypothetical protein [Candidatus Delongbacteria bacterium]MCG2761416.1 hypothetical protein [Candidatus Delongbacteria bacterium]
MSAQKYVRGNGAKALKKRFSIFNLFIKFSLFPLIIGLYVILQSQVKSICRETDQLNAKKNILAEELERITSEYDKMIAYSEISEFAMKELKMNYSVKNMKSFTVIDKNEIFKSQNTNELPQLFDTNVNLALIESDEQTNER